MISKDNKFKSFNDAKDKIAFMKEADLNINQKIWDWYQEWEEEELQMQSVACRCLKQSRLQLTAAHSCRQHR